ncbi:hypothetical protein B0T14DRAFT_139786 [Immersiella caudata]|uniref:Uncharacterized protein n=1 Tax=Immersiella caudata TaxID=314043 RepID=A0AA39X5E8_9PEZI|nr:hypothetical protein B0T14DRAFT_139786 [Immersiella caudata]
MPLLIKGKCWYGPRLNQGRRDRWQRACDLPGTMSSWCGVVDQSLPPMRARPPGDCPVNAGKTPSEIRPGTPARRAILANRAGWAQVGWLGKWEGQASANRKRLHLRAAERSCLLARCVGCPSILRDRDPDPTLTWQSLLRVSAEIGRALTCVPTNNLLPQVRRDQTGNAKGRQLMQCCGQRPDVLSSPFEEWEGGGPSCLTCVCPLVPRPPFSFFLLLGPRLGRSDVDVDQPRNDQLLPPLSQLRTQETRNSASVSWPPLSFLSTLGKSPGQH